MRTCQRSIAGSSAADLLGQVDRPSQRACTLGPQRPLDHRGELQHLAPEDFQIAHSWRFRQDRSHRAPGPSPGCSRHQKSSRSPLPQPHRTPTARSRMRVWDCGLRSRLHRPADPTNVDSDRACRGEERTREIARRSCQSSPSLIRTTGTAPDCAGSSGAGTGPGHRPGRSTLRAVPMPSRDPSVPIGQDRPRCERAPATVASPARRGLRPGPPLAGPAPGFGRLNSACPAAGGRRRRGGR